MGSAIVAKFLTRKCAICKSLYEIRECAYRYRKSISKNGGTTCSTRCSDKLRTVLALRRCKTVYCGICEKKMVLRQGDYTRRKRQTKSGRVFCGIKCLSRWKENTVTRPCYFCGSRFKRWAHKAKVQRYCSRRCAGLASRVRRPKRNCQKCGKGFVRLKAKGRPGKFCGNICFRKSMGSRKLKFKCETCSRVVLRTKSTVEDHMFCRMACYRIWLRKEQVKRNGKKCRLCSKTFVTRCKSEKARRRFCSQQCFLRSSDPTRPEMYVKKAIKDRGIYAAISQNPLKGFTFPDFVIPTKKMCVYVDGTYWHSKKKDKDQLQNKVLRAAGYKVVRIKEPDAIDENRLNKILDRIFKK